MWRPRRENGKKRGSWWMPQGTRYSGGGMKKVPESKEESRKKKTLETWRNDLKDKGFEWIRRNQNVGWIEAYPRWLIFGEHAPSVPVEVMKIAGMFGLSKAIDIFGRKACGDLNEEVREGESRETGVPSVNGNMGQQVNPTQPSQSLETAGHLTYSLWLANIHCENLVCHNSHHSSRALPDDLDPEGLVCHAHFVQSLVGVHLRRGWYVKRNRHLKAFFSRVIDL